MVSRVPRFWHRAGLGGGAGSGPTSTSSNGQKCCVCHVNVVFFLWKIILSFILLNGNVPPTKWTNSAYFMVRFITMENKPFHCLKMQHLFPFWVPNWPLLGENGKVGQNRTMNTRLACLKAGSQSFPDLCENNRTSSSLFFHSTTVPKYVYLYGKGILVS